MGCLIELAEKSPMNYILVQLYCFVEAELLCGDISSDDVLILEVSQCFKAESHVCWLERKGS